MKRSKRKYSKKNNSKVYFALSVVLTVLITFSFLFSSSSRPLNPLSPPSISGIYLPDPLTITFPPSFILGAQTIEPTDVVKYINIERTKVGSPPLRISPKLMEAAQKRAEVILKYQNFSHQDPFENTELVTVLPKVGYYYRYASENIGMGGVSAEDFVGGFMHSTSHRDNLLNTYLSDTGVAVVSGPYKQYYVNIAVQLFAIPGSEEDYLGYTTKDSEKYKTQLAAVESKLNPLYWTLNKLIHPDDFSDEKYKKLSRQKDILTSVYTRMKTKQPFQNEQVTLIMEYNRNL